jgi:hypothetical protein
MKIHIGWIFIMIAVFIVILALFGGKIWKLPTPATAARPSLRKGETSIISREVNMPAKSEDQRRAAGAALAAKRGETPVSSLKGAAKQMYHGMSEKELRDFAKKEKKWPDE